MLRNYLLAEKQEEREEIDCVIVLQDSTIESILWKDGDNYYIVEIEDIVTPSLVSFAETGLTNDQKVERENKARTIGYTLASGDTYRTNAITYYLEQCNINYHDQDVYDYFNTTYPDLFD